MYMKTRRVARSAFPLGLAGAWDDLLNSVGIPTSPAPTTDAGPATVVPSSPPEVAFTEGDATHANDTLRTPGGSSSGGGGFGMRPPNAAASLPGPGLLPGITDAFGKMSSIEKIAIVGALSGVAILAFTGPKSKKRRRS